MRRLVVVLIAVALAPAEVRGQRLEYVGVGGGLLSPAGTFGDVEKTGWHLLGTTVGRLRGSLGFTVDGLYGQTAHRDGVAGKSTLGGGTAQVAWFVGGEMRRVRPFVTAGVGLFSVSVEVPEFGSAAATKLALAGGGGVLVGSGRRRGFLAVRYVSVKTSPETTSFFPISAGIVFPIRGL